MRELGKEGLAVARLWLGKQTVVSHITVKMPLYLGPPHAEKWEELGTRLVKMPLWTYL